MALHAALEIFCGGGRASFRSERPARRAGYSRAMSQRCHPPFETSLTESKLSGKANTRDKAFHLKQRQPGLKGKNIRQSSPTAANRIIPESRPLHRRPKYGPAAATKPLRAAKPVHKAEAPPRQYAAAPPPNRKVIVTPILKVCLS